MTRQGYRIELAAARQLHGMEPNFVPGNDKIAYYLTNCQNHLNHKGTKGTKIFGITITGSKKELNHKDTKDTKKCSMRKKQENRLSMGL
jgi:hypothetical protein